jgi:uncharacterized membrane-anchored protein
MSFGHFRRVVAVASILLGALGARAGEITVPAEPATTKSEIELAFDAAGAAMVHGPAQVAIAGQGTLDLPQGYGYVPNPAAKRLLEAMGNVVGSSTQGVLVATDVEGLPWFTVVSYESEGYISDDDAKDWDTDELLQSFKDGTAEDNKRRRELGFGEIDIVGWAEAPRYDAATHRLVWSVETREHDGHGGTSQGVNYRTLQLGRHGYIAMNMVTDLSALPQFKDDAENLLVALSFDQGKRYADFNADTDKVAEYGLAALVAGVAAKKLGFLALAAAFAVKAWKLLLLAGVAASAGIKKFFGKKEEGAAA